MSGLNINFTEDYSDVDNYVPPEGNTNSRVMLIGEAPGETEIAHERPFVGRAGERLDEVLEQIGVAREDLYITNLVKERPPDNRDPTDEEIMKWQPMLKQELKEVQPDIIVTLGNFPTRTLLNIEDGITQIHGERFDRAEATVVPVYHPAATLYDGSKLPEFKDDLEYVFTDLLDEFR